jgi:hypothetical protein
MNYIARVTLLSVRHSVHAKTRSVPRFDGMCKMSEFHILNGDGQDRNGRR